LDISRSKPIDPPPLPFNPPNSGILLSKFYESKCTLPKTSTTLDEEDSMNILIDITRRD
jgi:hypothetical protein